MLRNVIAVILGVVVAVGVVALVEYFGHQVYPPPTDLDFNDKELLRTYLAQLPLGAMLFVLAAWWVGTLSGCFVTARIADWKPMALAGIVGGLMFAATASNLANIPHPTWFAITGLVGIVIMTLVGGRLAGPHARLTAV